MRIPVSAFITAKDEADRIARTIHSVSDWVDEVIVIDSGSSDGTVTLAEDAGARVIGQGWQGFGRQKRFGEIQCRNDWVLNIDADEVVSPELREEIVALFRSGLPELNAYGMPVPLIYPGWSKPRWLARDQWCVRFTIAESSDFEIAPSMTLSSRPAIRLVNWLPHCCIILCVRSPTWSVNWRTALGSRSQCNGRGPLLRFGYVW